MALDLRQNLKLTQSLLMTPQLQQAIKLLQLSRIELEQFVSQQLAENPILDEGADYVDQNSEKELVERTSEDFIKEQFDAELQTVDKSNNADNTEVDWEQLSRLKEASQGSSAAQKSKQSGEAPNYENMQSYATSLTDYLMRQIGELDFNKEEQKIAADLVGNLSEKGYLELDLIQYAADENLDFDLVEGVLDTIQRLQPPGIASRTLQECLLNQIREHKLKNGIVEVLIEEHLDKLENRNYALIAKKMKQPLDEIIKNAAIIAELDPIPAREFGGDPTYHVIPDVFIYNMAGNWVVSLNEEGLPYLKINSFYKDMAQGSGKEDKLYIQDKIKSAQWLIKSIQQRQKTIFKVTECIVKKQEDFFDKGIEHLKPLILKDVAEEIGLHESTVSRVTTNKYAHTPRGIFELKYFFNSSIASASGEGVASESVKKFIQDIVSKEDPKKPFSDQKIVAMLEEKDIRLARRTVAKYREQLGILPSSKRKKFF